MKLKVYKLTSEKGEVRLFLEKSLIEVDGDVASLAMTCIDGMEAQLLSAVNKVMYNRSHLLYEGIFDNDGAYDVKFADEPLENTILQNVYDLDTPGGRAKLLASYDWFACEGFDSLFAQAIKLGQMKVATHLE